jgi:hypothetical protein
VAVRAIWARSARQTGTSWTDFERACRFDYQRGPGQTSRAFLRSVLIAVVLAALHGAGTATPVSDALPIALSSGSSGFTVTNTSKSNVFVTLLLSGSNFRSEMPCEGTLYLPSGSQRAVVIAAKDRAKPLDYRVKVTRLESKTLNELRLEANSAPVATPLSAASAQAIEALRCQSQ